MLRWIYPYVSLQPLGRAIFESNSCVVLIDEVDKADIDFPNDLLQVLDAFTFDIDDLPAEENELCMKRHGFGRSVKPSKDFRPIVVITSNREKQLPDPFLRRCLYAWLSFPEEPEVLRRIVEMNWLGPPASEIVEDLIASAVDRFLAVRRSAETLGVQKKPATSELIDWVQALNWQGTAPKDISSGGQRPPYWRLLFKTMQDLESYDRRSRLDEVQQRNSDG